MPGIVLMVLKMALDAIPGYVLSNSAIFSTHIRVNCLCFRAYLNGSIVGRD